MEMIEISKIELNEMNQEIEKLTQKSRQLNDLANNYQAKCGFLKTKVDILSNESEAQKKLLGSYKNINEKLMKELEKRHV